MGLVKCPRCELNYMQEGEKMCAVCRRDLHGEEEAPDVELCTACGERPAAPGEDLCALCLREMRRTEGFQATVAPEPDAEAAIDPIAPTDIEEMEIELEDDDEIPDGELGEIDKELGADDEEEIVPESLEQLKGEELNAPDDDDDEVD